MSNTFKYICMITGLLGFAGVASAQKDDTKVIETKRVRIEVRNNNGKLDTTIVEEEKMIETTDDFEIIGGDSNLRVVEKIIEEEIILDDKEIKTVETNMWVMDWGVNTWLSNNAIGVPEGFESWELENIAANFHLGVIQQGINLYKGKLRFVYGLGIEFNNYRFEKGITVEPDTKPVSYTVDDVLKYKRNKVVSRYATVPLMLNFKSNPEDDDKSIKIAAGIQAGYLVGAHQKQKWGSGNQKEKKKIKGDYGFEDFRYGYVAQFGYGDFVLYGKYYPTNTFKKDRGPQVNTACVGLVIAPF